MFPTSQSVPFMLTQVWMIVAFRVSSIRLGKSAELKKYACTPRVSRRISLTSQFRELWVWMFQENVPDPFVVLRHPRRLLPKSRKERKWVVSLSSALMRAKRARRMPGSTERARMPLQKLRAYRWRKFTLCSHYVHITHINVHILLTMYTIQHYSQNVRKCEFWKFSWNVTSFFLLT